MSASTTVTDAPFRAKLVTATPATTADELMRAVGEAEAMRPPAVYVNVPWPDTHGLLAALSGTGRYRPRQVLPHLGAVELYAWLAQSPDVVPPPSTQNAGVSLIICGRDRSMCLIRERARGDRPAPLKFISGTVDPGELPTHAAAREAMEETAIDIHELAGGQATFSLVNGYMLNRFLGQQHIGDMHFYLAVFLPVELNAAGRPCRLNADGSHGAEVRLVPQQSEVAAIEWMSAAQVAELAADPGLRDKFKGDRFLVDFVRRHDEIRARPLVPGRSRDPEQTRFYFF